MSCLFDTVCPTAAELSDAERRALPLASWAAHHRHHRRCSGEAYSEALAEIEQFWLLHQAAVANQKPETEPTYQTMNSAAAHHEVHKPATVPPDDAATPCRIDPEVAYRHAAFPNPAAPPTPPTLPGAAATAVPKVPVPAPDPRLQFIQNALSAFLVHLQQRAAERRCNVAPLPVEEAEPPCIALLQANQRLRSELINLTTHLHQAAKEVRSLRKQNAELTASVADLTRALHRLSA